MLRGPDQLQHLCALKCDATVEGSKPELNEHTETCRMQFSVRETMWRQNVDTRTHALMYMPGMCSACKTNVRKDIPNG